VDLARLAGLPEAGVLAEVVNDDGSMARLPALRRFADEHGLALISISQLIEYRRHTELMVRRVAQTRLPNAYGVWQAYGYLNSVDGTEHVALVLGDLGDGEDLLTRVHSECLTGDVFGSRRCDCGAQLAAAMAAIAAEGRGAVLYLCRPTTCRTPAPTRWTPTSSLACPPTPASTPPAPRCSPTWACAPSGCSPTTRPRSAG
jgi:3,4-dihydroxy 2-butanone 4-phosphate synthase/GTP cyclohydrolase II